jgi:predicted nucleotidyltransferase
MTKQDELKKSLQPQPDLELTVLIGSQAGGNAMSQSDWDIAVRWKKNIRGTARLQRMEILKQQITNAIEIHKDQIDCIDMAPARLAMCTVIAKEGIILKGEDTLAWIHYLSQTWAELEEFYWRKSNAA